MTRDKDIREPLFDFLEDTYGKIRILEEKNMGKSRADIVMVTPGAIYGIEIKSDADTYTRLAGQVRDYDRYFDMNIVVVGSSHAYHIEEHVPEYWGIITVDEIEASSSSADGSLDFYVLRKPRPNPKCKLEHKLSLLWRTELMKIQVHLDMPKYKDKNRAFVVSKIIDTVTARDMLDELDHLICDILFDRDYNTIAREIGEFRKSELQKRIDIETDPALKLGMMLERASYKTRFKKKRSRRKRPGR